MNLLLLNEGKFTPIEYQMIDMIHLDGSGLIYIGKVTIAKKYKQKCILKN